MILPSSRFYPLVAQTCGELLRELPAATSGVCNKLRMLQRAAVRQMLDEDIRPPLLSDVDQDAARAMEEDYLRKGEASYRRSLAEFSELADGDSGLPISEERFAALLTSRTGAEVRIKSARLVPGGFSKVTIIVELEPSSSLPPTVVARIDRETGFLGTSVRDEYAVIEALHDNGVLVPMPIAEDIAGEVAGRPLIVVEALPGRTIGDMFNLPERNPSINLSIAAELARLHNVPLPAMRGTLRSTEKSTKQQAEEWLREARDGWKQVEAHSPIMDAGFDWLFRNLHRAEGDPVVMHGDFGLNNILIDGDRVAALLDWEFVRAGHAGFDLGWFHCMAEALGEWEDFLAAYERAGAKLPTVQELDFFILLANVRLASIIWQGAFAFETGRVMDLIFAGARANDQRLVIIRVAEQLRRIAQREDQS